MQPARCPLFRRTDLPLDVISYLRVMHGYVAFHRFNEMRKMSRAPSLKSIVASTSLGLLAAMMVMTALSGVVNAAIDAPVDRYGFGVALFKNADPWDYPANELILKRYGIPYDLYNSSDIAGVDLSAYAKVVIVSDQPQVFYDTVNASRTWFEGYVEKGGVLEIHAADNGWNGGSWIDMLPGGINYTSGSTNDVNIVSSAESHPVVRTPNEITNTDLDNWGSSAHGYFASPYPSGHIEIFEQGASPFTPVYIEAPHGSGVIIASSQTLEYAYKNGDSFALENSLLYLAPYEKLDVGIRVGTIHFRSEIAEFYVETSLHGNAINASIWEATMYFENGNQQADLMPHVEMLAVGLYKITYAIPFDAVVGTYTLSLEARYRTGMITATGHATASFLISPTLTSQNSHIVDIVDNVATVVIPNLDTIKVDLTEIDAKVTSLEGDTATIETDIGTMQTSVDNIEDLIGGIEDVVGGIDETTTPTYWFSIGSMILAAIAAVAAIVVVILVKKKPT